MEFALLTLCWIGVVVLALAIKDRFVDRPRMEKFNVRLDKLINSMDGCADAMVSIADRHTDNLARIGRHLGVELLGQQNGKDGG